MARMKALEKAAALTARAEGALDHETAQLVDG